MSHPKDIFDEIVIFVPVQYHAAYWRMVARLRDLPPDDEIVLFIQVMGIETFILRDLPAALVKERETLLAKLKESYEELSRRVAASSEQTREIASEAERVAVTLVQANDDMRATASLVTEAATTAANNMDVETMSRRLTAELEERTIQPHAKLVEQSMQSIGKLDEATASAQRAIGVWRKVHLVGAWVTAFLVSACVCGLILAMTLRGMEKEYNTVVDQRLAELTSNVEGNKEVLAALAQSKVKVHIDRTLKEEGGRERTEHFLALHPAVSARMETSKTASNIGVIGFHLEPESGLVGGWKSER